ncbi:MAG: hypothetical protein KBC57_00020 [Neisseriaceae bacterium]|nr:hypothetical protein [Neisseriaceae bacterium]
MTFSTQTLTGILCGTLMQTLVWAQPSHPPLSIYASAYGFSTQWQDQKGFLPLSYALDVPYSNSLDHVKMAHTVYLDVAKGPLGVYYDKQYYKASVDDRIEQFPARINVKMARQSIGTYLKVHDGQRSLDEPFLTLAPTIGVHLTEIDVDVKADVMGQTLTASRSASWHEPYIGARFAYNINRHWVLFGQINAGNRHSREQVAYVAYRSKLFNQPINVRLGYRRLDQKHIKDDFIWDITEKNLMLGFSIQLL